jgi:hypothetical protein
MVSLLTLDQSFGVRIPVSQLTLLNHCNKTHCRHVRNGTVLADLTEEPLSS